MKSNDKNIYVFEEFGSGEAKLLGKMRVQLLRGEEIFSFEYDKDWLKANKLAFLDPDMPFYEGVQYPVDNKKQFGIFMDSEPDRWGRTLLKRREAILAKKEGRAPRTLLESDYLLGISDYCRSGALRFKSDIDGPFLAPSSDLNVPPIKDLRELEAISLEYESDDDKYFDAWSKMLLSPGSSLGGARPKANVKDVSGDLWIAKFPSKNDDYDVGAWEFLANRLAASCGLNVVSAKIAKYSSYGSTFLSKRFDRQGNKRIHFSSAMSLLGKKDGESSDCSYLDLLDFITSYGENAREDARELWKRIAYSVAIKNTDDHLRNHGFILGEHGWRLAPLYDVNPNIDGSSLSLNINSFDNSLDFSLLLSVAPLFFVSKEEGKKIIEDMQKTIKEQWRPLAIKIGISKASIEEFACVFERY